MSRSTRRVYVTQCLVDIAKSRIALFACWSVVAVVFVLMQLQLGLSQVPLTLKAPPPRPEHMHVVVRTPNGNDYGKDLLRKHYEQSHKPART